MSGIASSELILNADGSIYHLKLKPEHIADNVLLVGDPGRVARISAHFDAVEAKIANREFVTHVGVYRGMRITVIGTGIGTDNIDIVLNELDALVNVDLATRSIKPHHTSLNLVRMGTSGALQADIPVDSMVISKRAIGLDGVLHFYQASHVLNSPLSHAFDAHMVWPEAMGSTYAVDASESLVKRLRGDSTLEGITLTANGFYGPQGRVIRGELAVADVNERIASFDYHGERLTNYEMETSALYGLGQLLGHQTATVCAIIANRPAGQYSKDHHSYEAVMIEKVLTRLTAS